MSTTDHMQKTDIGPIPVDWALRPLAQLGEPKIGLTYSPADVRESGTLVLRSSNVQQERLAFNDNVYVRPEIATGSLVDEGDILICVRNGSRSLIGKCARIDASAKGMAFGAFMSVFRSPHSGLLFHQFRSDIIGRQIAEHLGATINQITNGSLKSFRVPFPPNEGERQRIAQALSDIDDLIASLDALIAKKRDIKQGAMQQLLSGKRRLPGFQSEWKSKSFSDLVTLPKGQVDPKKHPYNSMLLVGPEHIEEATGRLSMPGTAAEQGAISGKYVFAEGDIIYGKINPHLRKVALAPFDGICSADLYPLRPKADMSSMYLAGVLLGEEFTRYATSQSARSGIPKINRSELAGFSIMMPDFLEQQAIATVLRDMDRDLYVLTERLEKYSQIRQGMMQQLLTGRIRLQ